MRLLIAVGIVAVGIAAAIAAVMLTRDDSSTSASSRPQVFKITTLEAPVVSIIRTQGRARFPESESEGEAEPELEPRTPLDAGDTLLAQDIPQTDIASANDPRGTPDAFVMPQSSRLRDDVNVWRAGDVAEPTVAVKGDRMLVTWNWHAAVSTDGGKIFRAIDPKTAFEEPHAPTTFCCDQIALYVPSADLWVWLLQYDDSDDAGNVVGNVLRIATARGDTEFDSPRFPMRSFLVSPLDFEPLHAAANASFDYSDLAITKRFLYLAVNVFGTDATVVVRYPLEQLASGVKPVGEAVVLAQKTVRLASGAGDTMYFAQHNGSRRLLVYRWADEEPAPDAPKTVSHRGYDLFGGKYSCPLSGYAHGDWCERKDDDGNITNDDRPRTAWLSGDTLGFAWNAPADRAAGFRFPFVATVLVDTKTMQATQASAIWNPEYAFQYAALAPNARGEVGGVALAGGGARPLSCVALLGGSDGSWEARLLDESDQIVLRDATGDYLSSTRSGGEGGLWTGSCMTSHKDANGMSIRVVQFGRAKDLAR